MLLLVISLCCFSEVLLVVLVHVVDCVLFVSSLQWVTKNVSDAQVQWGTEKGQYDQKKNVSYCSMFMKTDTENRKWQNYVGLK